MSVKQRITEYIKFKGITKISFCKKIGVSNAFISSMRVSIQPDKLKSIALNYPDLNLEWLIQGEGEMLKNEEKRVLVDDNKTLSNQEIMSKLVITNETLAYQNGELIKILSEHNYIARNNSDTIRNLSYKVNTIDSPDISKNVQGEAS